MSDIDVRLEFLDNDAINYLQQIRDLSQEAGTALQDANTTASKSLGDAAGAASKLTDEEKKLKDSADKAKTSIDAQEKSTKEFKNTVKEAAGNLTIMGVNVGQVGSKLSAFGTNIRKGSIAIGSSTKALKIFKIALASTGIGLIIVALGSLITYFTKTQKGLDLLSRGFNVVKSVIDNVIDRISLIGAGFLKIMGGDVKEGFKEIINSLNGLGKEIKEDAKATDELTKRSQNLLKLKDALTVEDAKRRAEIQKLREESRMLGVSDEEALKKLKEAGRLENQLASLKSIIAKEELDIITEKNKLAESFNADNKAAAEAQAKVYQVESEKSGEQLRLLTEIQSLTNKGTAEAKAAAAERQKEIDEQTQKLEDYKAAYVDITQSIADRLQSEKLATLEGRERLAALKDIADQEINILEQRARAAALFAGKEFTLGDQFQELRDNLNKSFAKQAKEQNAKDNPIIGMLGSAVGSSGKAKLDEIAGEVVGELDDSMVGAAKALGEIRLKLFQWTGIKPEEQAQIEQEVFGVFRMFSDANDQAIDRQLDKNKELLDTLKDRKDQAKELLEEELENQAAGYASDVGNREDYYNKIVAQEAAAGKEREQLLKKQHNQQVAQEIAQQVVSLGTAAANFFASGAKFGPIIGITMASAAIGAMFAIMKATRSRASQTSKNFTGGVLDLASGQVDRHGSNDQYGRGYAIEGTNKIIGGNEFIVKQSKSIKDLDFLKAYNAGKLDWIDFNQLAKSGFSAFEPVTEVVGDVGVRSKGIASKGLNFERQVENALIKVMPALFDRNSSAISSSIMNRKEYTEVGGELLEYSQTKKKKIKKLN